MLDNAYSWALVWIDQHTNSHFRDHYEQLETERQDRILRFGEPVLSADLRGWWSPDVEDTHRIRALNYYERYEHQPTGRVNAQENPHVVLRGEGATFHWLNEFPPPILQAQPSPSSTRMCP